MLHVPNFTVPRHRQKTLKQQTFPNLKFALFSTKETKKLSLFPTFQKHSHLRTTKLAWFPLGHLLSKVMNSLWEYDVTRSLLTSTMRSPSRSWAQRGMSMICFTTGPCDVSPTTHARSIIHRNTWFVHRFLCSFLFFPSCCIRCVHLCHKELTEGKTESERSLDNPNRHSFWWRNGP